MESIQMGDTILCDGRTPLRIYVSFVNRNKNSVLLLVAQNLKTMLYGVNGLNHSLFTHE